MLKRGDRVRYLGMTCEVRQGPYSYPDGNCYGYGKDLTFVELTVLCDARGVWGYGDILEAHVEEVEQI